MADNTKGLGAVLKALDRNTCLTPEDLAATIGMGRKDVVRAVGKRDGQHLANATAAWGDPLPLWVDALARACDASSLSEVGRRPAGRPGTPSSGMAPSCATAGGCTSR